MTFPRHGAVLRPARRRDHPSPEVQSPPTVQGRAPVSGAGSRSRVITRTARATDLPAVLGIVRQHRADAHAEDVLTGHTRLNTAAAGFRRLLEDPGHRVVLAVLPGSPAPDGGGAGEVAVGLAVLGLDPLSLVLATRRSPSRRSSSIVGTAGAGRGRSCSPRRRHTHSRPVRPMCFAPLTTRRIVAVDSLIRSLATRQRNGLPVPAPRRERATRRPGCARTAGPEVRRRRVSAVIRRR